MEFVDLEQVHFFYFTVNKLKTDESQNIFL